MGSIPMRSILRPWWSWVMKETTMNEAMSVQLEALADDLRNALSGPGVFDVAVVTDPDGTVTLEGPLVSTRSDDEGLRGSFAIVADGDGERAWLTYADEAGVRRREHPIVPGARTVLAVLAGSGWELVELDDEDATYPCQCGEIVRDGVACHDGAGCDGDEDTSTPAVLDAARELVEAAIGDEEHADPRVVLAVWLLQDAVGEHGGGAGVQDAVVLQVMYRSLVETRTRFEGGPR